MALIRQQIMDAIFVRLRSITIANGYTRDVGERRVYHESELPENVPPPAILVLEGDERVSFDSTENYRCTIPLQVAFIARVKGQEAGDEVARAFMAEVQRAMGNEFEITTTGYSRRFTIATLPTQPIGTSSTASTRPQMHCSALRWTSQDLGIKHGGT